MPRRRSRFADLEKQFRAAGGVAGAGSAVAKYIEFKSGKTKIARRTKVTLTAAERTRYGISLIPFNAKFETGDDATAKRYQAAVTKFSADGAKNVGLSNAELGWDKTTAASAVAINDAAYYPALIRPIVPTGTTATPLSSITGREYKYKEARSYGVPFGRTNAAAAIDTEEDRRQILTAKARQATGAAKVSSVGYDPEVFRSDNSALEPLDGV
jgi:hypothetical protein